MWSLVEQLALEAGTTKVVDRDGRLIAASGDEDKEAVFELEKGPVVGPLGSVAVETSPRVLGYTDVHGVPVLAARAPIAVLTWGVILEQPVAVALAVVENEQRRLTFTMAGFLLLTLGIGAFGARVVTRPLKKLETRTIEIAQGRLEGRVEPLGAREIA